MPNNEEEIKVFYKEDEKNITWEQRQNQVLKSLNNANNELSNNLEDISKDNQPVAENKDCTIMDANQEDNVLANTENHIKPHYVVKVSKNTTHQSEKILVINFYLKLITTNIKSETLDRETIGKYLCSLRLIVDDFTKNKETYLPNDNLMSTIKIIKTYAYKLSNLIDKIENDESLNKQFKNLSNSILRLDLIL